MCDRLGLDVWEVIDAAATKPFGFMPFYPGPGLGGHCIPIDPHYLAWKLKTLDYQARFIQLASHINGTMPNYVVTKVTSALNDEKKSVRDSNIMILGVAYKPNVNDVRESPALDIIRVLEKRGAKIYFNDPHVNTLTISETRCIELKRTPLTANSLKKMDCVIIITNHARFNYPLVCRYSHLIVDTRNATKEVKSPSARIVKI
jgi:UDP-N-acetyl-D-glucosamine dehydrogenase